MRKQSSTPQARRILFLCLVFVIASLLVVPVAHAGKKKSKKHRKHHAVSIGAVPAVVVPGPSSLSAHINVAVDDQTVPAASRKARLTLVLANEGTDARLALCPMLNFSGADRTLQGYGYLSEDGTPDCTVTTSHPPSVSTSLDPLQAVPQCPATGPVVGDIVTVPGGAGTPGQLVIIHEATLANLGAGLETMPAADVRSALLAGGGTRLEVLSNFGSGISALVCPNGVDAFLAEAPASDVASEASVWYQAPVAVAPTVTVETSLSSATTFGMLSDASANVEILWQDNPASSLSGHLTNIPASGSPFTLPKATFFEGALTATFPDTLPEGFLGEATVRVTDAGSGAELARSMHLFAKDTTPPAITAAASVRDADSVDLSLTAADAGTFINAARLTPSVDGAAEPGTLMDLTSGNFSGLTSFASSISPITSEQRVGAAVAVSDELENTASAVLPVAGAGPDRIVECDSTEGAHVTLDGALSTTPPESPTTFTWNNSFGTVTGETADVVLPLGDNLVTLTLQDARGFTGTDQIDITVVDTTPPVIDAIIPNPACLWPPNHGFVRYTLGANFQVKATDVCDANPVARIVDVTSDQAANARGSGHTAPDVVFGSGGFCVRAERAGGDKDGRIYTVTVAVSDASGNTTQATSQVRVAHDQSGHDCPPAKEKFVVADDDPACSPERLAAPSRSR